jgi:hypothetical protein
MQNDWNSSSTQAKMQKNASLLAASLAGGVGVLAIITLLSFTSKTLPHEVAKELSVWVPAAFYIGFSLFSFLLAASRPAFTELWSLRPFAQPCSFILCLRFFHNTKLPFFLVIPISPKALLP